MSPAKRKAERLNSHKREERKSILSDDYGKGLKFDNNHAKGSQKKGTEGQHQQQQKRLLMGFVS